MPFEAYKARIKIVRDEEVVKKWVEEQSWKTEYVCLNMPEPLRLPSREAVEQHFRQHHKDNIIKKVESHTLAGTAARGLRSPELARLVRQTFEDQRRFPLQVATVLSHQFASHGLQFFKVNRTVTHVSVARPHYLEMEATPVSEGVKRIVDYINAHPKCTRRSLIEAMAPCAPPAVTHTPASVAAPKAIEAAGEPSAPPGEGATAAATASDEPTPPQPAPKPEAAEPTAEQTAVIADLHWLVHEGHVLEFANGVLEAAKKPLPRPPKPEPKSPAKAEEAAALVESEPAPEATAPDPGQGNVGQGNETGAAPAAEGIQPTDSPADVAAPPAVETGAAEPVHPVNEAPPSVQPPS